MSPAVSFNFGRTFLTFLVRPRDQTRLSAPVPIFQWYLKVISVLFLFLSWLFPLLFLSLSIVSLSLNVWSLRKLRITGSLIPFFSLYLYFKDRIIKERSRESYSRNVDIKRKEKYWWYKEERTVAAILMITYYCTGLRRDT